MVRRSSAPTDPRLACDEGGYRGQRKECPVSLAPRRDAERGPGGGDPDPKTARAPEALPPGTSIGERYSRVNNARSQRSARHRKSKLMCPRG